MTLYKKSFENIVGKGENAGNQHFLLFSQCFLPFQKHSSIVEFFFFLSFPYLNLDLNKILSFVKGFTKFCRLVKGLSFTKGQNFRLLQIESINFAKDK